MTIFNMQHLMLKLVHNTDMIFNITIVLFITYMSALFPNELSVRFNTMTSVYNFMQMFKRS